MAGTREKDFDNEHHRGDESHLLRDILRTSQVLMNGFSRKIGMSASRLALLRLLAVTDEDIGVMDIANRLGINAAAVTRQVKEMEKEGLIKRRNDPRDRRRNYVDLSSKGRGLFEYIHMRSHELEHALSMIISAEEVATTVTVLAKLREFVESYTTK